MGKKSPEAINIRLLSIRQRISTLVVDLETRQKSRHIVKPADRERYAQAIQHAKNAGEETRQGAS